MHQDQSLTWCVSSEVTLLDRLNPDLDGDLELAGVQANGR